MTPVADRARKSQIPWTFCWFGLLLLATYAPVLQKLGAVWYDNPDMGHGFFVPVLSVFMVWQRREELLAIKPQPNWWGLAVVLWGMLLLILGTLGAEPFLSNTAFVITLVGVLWTLGGTIMLNKLAFPLFLLCFMIPLPAVIYTRLTFPLQILASKLATGALMLVNVPVLREGNVLELPTQKLSVVEACSGIRSLLSLTFLSLVYGHFFERRTWLRVVLFLSTIPIAILANGSRVTITGIVSQIKPELAEGFFHESTGWVIFMIALGILVLFHRILARGAAWAEARRTKG